MLESYRRAARACQAREVVIDILFLAHGRSEFTAASYRALIDNTGWSGARLILFTDGDLPRCPGREPDIMITQKTGGPIAIMLDYLAHAPLLGCVADLFVKIDNDVIVPPGWLDQCVETMEAHPELDLLGIEPPASRTPAPWAKHVKVDAPEHRCAGAKYARCARLARFLL